MSVRAGFVTNGIQNQIYAIADLEISRSQGMTTNEKFLRSQFATLNWSGFESMGNLPLALSSSIASCLAGAFATTSAGKSPQHHQPASIRR